MANITIQVPNGNVLTPEEFARKVIGELGDYEFLRMDERDGADVYDAVIKSEDGKEHRVNVLTGYFDEPNKDGLFYWRSLQEVLDCTEIISGTNEDGETVMCMFY